MTIVITSKRDGFRRCGVTHPGKPTYYPDDFFTHEQLEALDKEPQLILAYVGEAFDQVKDVLDDTLSQTPPSQALDAIPGTQPQAPETVLTSVAAPVVSDAARLLVDEPGTDAPGLPGDESTGADGLVIDGQGTSASDGAMAGQLSRDTSLANDQSAASAPGAPGANSSGDSGPSVNDQGVPAEDGGASDQAPGEQPDATKDTAKPATAKPGRAKGAAK